MVTGECTFEIKTLNPKYTYPLIFQNGQVTSAYVANKYWRILVRILTRRSQVLSTM